MIDSKRTKNTFVEAEKKLRVDSVSFDFQIKYGIISLISTKLLS